MEIMVRKPIVSIIIDTYNYGEFIEDAIESSLNQTFPQKDIEVIVVDDGSTDDTPLRVKKYRDRIRYIYKENGGQASAFNLGFRVARGEYICLLDADDYYAPCKVERVVEEFERYRDVVYIGNAFQWVDNKNRKIEVKFWNPDYKEFHNLSLNKKNLFLFFNSFTITSGISIRKKILKNLLPLREKSKIGADMCISLGVMWFGNLSFLKEKLTFYRLHGKNLWSVFNIKNFDLQIEAMKNAYLYAKKAAKKAKNFNFNIYKKYLKLWEISILEKMIYQNYVFNGIKIKDLIKFEIKKTGIYFDYDNTFYRTYKIMRLPYLIFLILFCPKIYIKMKNFYFWKRIFNIRRLFFPD